MGTENGRSRRDGHPVIDWHAAAACRKGRAPQNPCPTDAPRRAIRHPITAPHAGHAGALTMTGTGTSMAPPRSLVPMMRRFLTVQQGHADRRGELACSEIYPSVETAALHPIPVFLSRLGDFCEERLPLAGCACRPRQRARRASPAGRPVGGGREQTDRRAGRPDHPRFKMPVISG